MWSIWLKSRVVRDMAGWGGWYTGHSSHPKESGWEFLEKTEVFQHKGSIVRCVVFWPQRGERVRDKEDEDTVPRERSWGSWRGGPRHGLNRTVLERYIQHMAEKPTSVGLSFVGHYVSTKTWCVASSVRISLEIPRAGQTCAPTWPGQLEQPFKLCILSANLRNLSGCFRNWPKTWGCSGGCGGSLSPVFHDFAYCVPDPET